MKNFLIQRTNTVSTFVLILFFLGGIFFLKGRITGDGFSYYAWLRSPVMDHDFDFHNEYSDYNNGYWTDDAEVTETGLRSNPFSVGPAILWMPWFGFAYILTAIFGRMLEIPNDGYSFFYQLLIPLGSYIYAMVGTLLISNILLQYSQKKVVFFSILGAVFASPLLGYLYGEAASSHPLSFFMVSLFLWYYLKSSHFNSDSDTIIGGILAGLLVLVRWQHVIFIVPIIFEKIFRQKNKFHLFLFFTPLVVLFSLQMIAWRIVYGHFLYLPQKATYFMSAFDLGGWLQNLLRLLFSPNHGFYFWTPLMIVGTYGIIYTIKRSRFLGLSFLFIIISSFLVNSFVKEYNAGWSYGARRLIEILPILAIGFSVFWNKISHKGYMVWITLTAIVWNFLLWFQFSLGSISRIESLSVPGFIWGQFTHAFEGLSTAVGKSVVFSNAYCSVASSSAEFCSTSSLSHFAYMGFFAVLLMTMIFFVITFFISYLERNFS